MFKDMRLKEMQMDENKAKDLLSRCDYGILSTIGEDEYCYGVPLNYVYFDEAIYFHCATEGHKLENLRGHHKVSFCVVGRTEILAEEFDTKYESTIIFGIAEEIEGEEKENVLVAFLRKYSPNFVETGKKYIEAQKHQTKVVKIVIDRMTGKGIY